MPTEPNTPPVLERAKAQELCDRIQAIMEEAWPYLRGAGEYDHAPMEHPVMRALHGAAEELSAAAAPGPRTYGNYEPREPE
ncbi:hypothetical protein GFY24_17390 [Nocardia sp. SYP-A9097]|uniref:hypothetical protein n=1 Tax=Nocardia sp. SYP-A9097 TaxID=2663237 RepID=UPI00129AED6D|nr:hypothetical protein [Nocardia sp. SYP-A9097]MRH89202.1 hypothetical protein [Nocardia sp. SYP-A9097]